MANERLASLGQVQASPEAAKVLRNTYWLLSLTLLFSAAVAGTAMAINAPHPGLIITLVGYFGLLFAVEKTKNSGWGLVTVFALTGFMGYTIGPILNAYMGAFANGGEIVMTAMGGTGAIFLGLSGYAIVSGRRFNQWAGALFVGILVAFVLGLGAVFFQIPALSLAVSAMFVLLMSGLILYQTGEIVNGGETNYISATVTLFVSIYNLFLSLLHLLGAFMGEE
ncbi:Bax inhibitor-1/YccA family protein [Spectribacter hydrogenoxidans]|uniref:Bax inhibitor-1/YccA family protein n=1 Tax=Spectribacter hydrogenoxidans TaxID=3075608 RepID=A0ABU3C3P2_9GAMM|nr:Bax inhibitor-1/YccA family protein [Salinisphaera sp. W335]MDT0636182.1 Bax inhibitor-1/YccA family protein [Salinisphaera sp. W335]